MKKYIYILVAILACTMFNSCGDNTPTMLYTAYTNTPFMTVKVFSGNAAKAEAQKISSIVNEVREVKKERKIAGISLGEEITYEKVHPQHLVPWGCHTSIGFSEPLVLCCTGNANKAFDRKLTFAVHDGLVNYYVLEDDIIYFFKDGSKIYVLTTNKKLYRQAYNEISAAPHKI